MGGQLGLEELRPVTVGQMGCMTTTLFRLARLFAANTARFPDFRGSSHVLLIPSKLLLHSAIRSSLRR